jgi:predicted N-acyltransferase
LRIEVIDRLAAIDPEQWDALTGGGEPFLRHAFLDGLERHGCLGERYGWYPQHILLWGEDRDELLAAAPCYVKTNNYGEFVFDWSWQAAWERQGQGYYPKLVISIPYTPATGPRLLVHPSVPDAQAMRRELLLAAARLADRIGASGVHVLFPPAGEIEAFPESERIVRTGCQYHWHNQNYSDFDAFLAALNSKRRKTIKRERRRVREAGVVFRVSDGGNAKAEDWRRFHEFYVDTFTKHMGIPTLSEAFFTSTAAALGSQVLLFEALQDEKTIAAALCYRSDDTLYGRFWGCREDLPDLHFETCYYQGIEFCIQQGLQRFEPGAQGEHKIPRGFLPRPTYSLHRILTPGFAPAVRDFCARETHLMQEHCAELMKRSPYREEDDSNPDAAS